MAQTKYCSASCQKEDWARHKPFCKAARAISKYQSAVLQANKLQPSQPQPHDLQIPKTQGPELSSDEAKASKIQSDQPLPLELLPDNESNSCAACQSPAAYACQGCKGALTSTSGLVSTTYYCSLRCQQASWTSHKKACLAAQARLKLYEAGTVLQERYFWYIRAMVTVMKATNTLDGGFDRGYKIVYEKDSIPRSIKASALLEEMNHSSEEARVYMACLIGSVHRGPMATSVKEFLNGKHCTTTNHFPPHPSCSESYEHPTQERISNTSSHI